MVNTTKLDDNYKYILQHIDGDTKLTLEFNAELDIWELGYKIRDFLCGCSWTEHNVNKIMKEDE